MEAGASKKEPKVEGKAADDELSMEEILQSIRRIIADDDTDDKKAPAENKNNGKGKKMEDDVPGSNMLELTEMLKEDGTVVDLKKEPAITKPVVEEPASFDILNSIDEALVEKPAAAAPAPLAEAISPMVAAAAPVAAPAPAPAAASAQDAIDSLLSNEAAQATSDAFKRLKQAEPEPAYIPSGAPLPGFSSGGTIEDMVANMLRPMLKGWLDANLPAIVQQIVEREVRKLTK